MILSVGGKLSTINIPSSESLLATLFDSWLKLYIHSTSAASLWYYSGTSIYSSLSGWYISYGYTSQVVTYNEKSNYPEMYQYNCFLSYWVCSVATEL